MCITFFYLAPAEGQSDSSAFPYALVLVMNREERLIRATQTAQWDEHAQPVLAGRDLTPGREGGTWLGMERGHGKVGLLTNMYVGGRTQPQAQGRGFLVIDLLRTPESGRDYLSRVAHSGVLYNPFNLLAFDRDSVRGNYQAHYHACHYEDPASSSPLIEPVALGDGCHGLSNHPYHEPFLKTEQGLDQFRGIIAAAQSAGLRDELVPSLYALMCNRERFGPDAQMIRQAGPGLVPPSCLGSIFVEAPDYGTRTQTVILVDHSGHTHFEERTRTGPNDWSYEKFDFVIGAET